MLEIKKLTNENLEDYYKIDNSFITNEKAILKLSEAGQLDFYIQPIEPIQKPWEKDSSNASSYLESNDKIVFFAYHNNKLTGQIEIHKSWNNFGFIFDLRVSKECRRQGIGKVLIQKAIDWSLQEKLVGLRLETQDINVSACKFYRSMGFKLHGFDQKLYYGIPDDQNLIALYWYYTNL